MTAEPAPTQVNGGSPVSCRVQNLTGHSSGKNILGNDPRTKWLNKPFFIPNFFKPLPVLHENL